jgi:hypothetical protein
MDEKTLTEEIRNGNISSVAKLADLMHEQDRGYVEHRIRDAMEHYKDKPDDLRDMVLKYIFNLCVKCGSHNTSVKNYNMMWHDGDITCDDCGEYVRMYDAG